MTTIFKTIEVEAEVEVELHEMVEAISDDMSYHEIFDAFNIEEHIAADCLDAHDLVEAISMRHGREVLTRHLLIGEFLDARTERDGIEDVLQSIPVTIKQHIIREWLNKAIKDLG